MTRQTAASEQPARRAELVRQILDNRKYRGMDIPASTVEDLLEREFAAGLSEKEAVKAVKTRLHNIVAAYLGDPDYQAAARLLDEAFASAGTPCRPPAARSWRCMPPPANA
jgi:16S rRNA (guanine(1405)-N(7))-methyltransferase